MSLETFSSIPGVATPGGPALSSLRVKLLCGFGTDSIDDLADVFGFPMLAVWQIG